jgi:hypothetical protein
MSLVGTGGYTQTGFSNAGSPRPIHPSWSKEYVLWICPVCSWAANDPKRKWTGQCAYGHPVRDLEPIVVQRIG